MQLAFASCAKLQQTNPQPVWGEIAAQRPDALLLLGDTIYLDHDHHAQAQALADELRRLYQAQFAEPHFAALLADLRARGAALLAIYDDHDFLGNDRCGGDHDPALALAARHEFIRAFKPVMTGAEVYRREVVGPCDVLVLDARFHRRAPSASAQDRDALLGAAQWAWFEQAVLATPAQRYLVIASSTTVHTWGTESWEHYPAAFSRLRQLLASHPTPLVLTGDVHRNAAFDDSGIVEIVSSGVARNSMVYGAPRQNWGLLRFDDQGVSVDLRALKAGGRFNFRIPRAHWALP